MRAKLGPDGLDVYPHHFLGGWYYETPRGIDIYATRVNGFVGIISQRSLRAYVRRLDRRTRNVPSKKRR